MPPRSRGRAPRRDVPADDGYGGYYGYDDDRDHDGPPPAARRNGSGRPPGPRNGAAGRGPTGRRPLRDDDHEPAYARDHTPLGYDGGDPDDPPLFTHGRNGSAGPAPRGRDEDDYDEDDEYYDDDPDGYEYDDGEYDEHDYDEDDYDEEYDDDAYGVGDGPLAVPPPGSGGRPLGPADVEELDPSMTDALARVDLGSMQVPVPFGADLSLEPAEGGRPQAVHLMLPEGRIAVSALAAPRSSGLWPELADEIEESLRGGGARVRSATGDWGRELHARTDNASSVFIGADGPRWMVYGVATASLETVEALDVELRRVMRGIVVVRGKLPYPPRTVLPLERAEDRAEAQAAAQNKPRGASITVSVPAARTSGATPVAAARGGAAPAAGTTRTPAARNGAAPDASTTRTPAARNGAAPDASTTRTPAARNGVVRDPAARNGRSGPGPDLPGAGRGPGSAGRPPADGGRPDERARRPATSQPGRPRRDPARGPVTGEQTPARAPRDPETTALPAVRRGPDPAGAPGTRGGPAAPSATGGAPARGGVEDAEAATPRLGVEQTGSVAARGRPEATGTTGRSRVERTGAVDPGRRGPGDSGAARRAVADTGAARARSRPPEYEPEYEPEPPVTRMLPAVEAPGAGHTDVQPVVDPAADPRSPRRALDDSRRGPDDFRRSAEYTGRSPAERPEPAFPTYDDVVDEPPARRDPAVTALPALPGVDPGPTTAGRHGGHPVPDDGLHHLPDPAAGLPLADESTPRGGTGHRFAGGTDRWDPVDPGYPLPSIAPDPEPVPLSRMAIEDIPLSDVELLDATLDSEPEPEPVPEPAPLPRRRPGATRRAASPPSDQVRAGRRRRGAEDDVVSEWMSAEIAARPSGRHAQPGDGSAVNGARRRSRAAGRASDRHGRADVEPVRGADLFRSAHGDPADADRAPGTDRAPGNDGAAGPGGGGRRRNGRARNGADGSVDPMTLFGAARDQGRHRRP